MLAESEETPALSFKMKSFELVVKKAATIQKIKNKAFKLILYFLSETAFNFANDLKCCQDIIFYICHFQTFSVLTWFGLLNKAEPSL